MDPTSAPPAETWLGKVNVPGLVSIAVFYLIILLIGIWAGRKSFKKGKSDVKDVFLAGRSMGFILGTITLTATWVGGGYINGTAEIVATPGYGLVWCQAPICYSISLMMGGIFFAKKMRAGGYITMLDPLAERFGSRMGGLLFLPALTAETLWSAAVLAALGSTLQVIVGLTNIVSIIVSAVIAVMYTMVGGLYSVAYTDVVQLFLIPLGLWLSFPFALNHKAVTNLTATSSEWLGKYDVAYTGMYIDGILLLIMGGIPWQAYFQRVLGSKTPTSARWMSIFAGIGCLIMGVPAVCIGAVAASTDWNQTTYDGPVPLEQYKLVLPMVLQYLCPVSVSFVGLGAVSAAVMSSADSSILSASSMFARNVWKLVFRPQASEREVIWVMRVAVVFVGAIGALMAILVQSVYDLFYLCSDFVYVVLFPQLTMVLYNQTINTYGSVLAYITGLLFRFLGGDTILKIPAVIIYPMYDASTNTQLFPYKTLAMLLSLFVLIVVSYFTNWLFKSGIVPLQYDFFQCFHQEERKDEIRFDNLAPGAMPPKSDISFVSPASMPPRSEMSYGTQSTLVPDGPLY